MEEYLIGESGSDKILNSLSRTTQPIQFLDDFQRQYGLSKTIPSVQPALKLLDLHQISRSGLYAQLLQCLCDDLLVRVKSMPPNEMEALLDQSFPYISFDELKSIPMNVMKLMPEVPYRFLKKLSETPELYEQCPIEVKRQIWLINESLFREKLLPLIMQYVDDPYLFGELNEMIVETHVLPSKRRENNTILKEIASLIGKSLKLYHSTISFIRQLYTELENVGSLCTLRADLLMLFHDNGVSEIYNNDRAHSIAWCVDACMRENIVDLRRVKEIQGYFQEFGSHGGVALADIAMVFANPFAMHCLLRNVLMQLTEVVRKKQVPKEDENIKYITFLMTLATRSHEMVREQKYKIPHVKKQVFNTFYPIIAAQIVDDFNREREAIRQASIPPPTAADAPQASVSAIPASTGSSIILTTTSTVTTPQQKSDKIELEEVEEVDSNLPFLFLNNPLCKKILFTYIIKKVSDKDCLVVHKYLKFISQNDHDEEGLSVLIGETSFIQSLVTQILHAKDPKMSFIVVEEFLLKYKHIPFIFKQILRYLLESYSRLNQREFSIIVQRLFTIDSQQQTNYTTKMVDELTTMTKSFLDKAGTRLNDRNVPLLLDFIKMLASQKPSSLTIVIPPPSHDSDDNIEADDNDFESSMDVDVGGSLTNSSSNIAISSPTNKNIQNSPTNANNPIRTPSPPNNNNNNNNNTTNNNNNNNTSNNNNSSSNSPTDDVNIMDE